MITWHFKAFRNLSKSELYNIIQLRIQVFIIEQNAPYQDCDGKDFDSFHLFGTKNNKIIAYARLIPAGISYVEPCLGRVVTSEKYRKHGYGKKLVELALEIMKTQFKTSACRISAQLYLQSFYESYGFKRVSETYLEDGLPHIEMSRSEV